MTFEQHYEAFWNRQLNLATGGRKRRLLEGHGHLEKPEVWWPVMRCFDYLHPEYEVYDFKDGARYIDFAYMREPHRIAFELDGFGSHGRDLSTRQFADDRQRQKPLGDRRLESDRAYRLNAESRSLPL